MKMLLAAGCLLALVPVVQAEGDFTRGLTVEERAAAGLDRLTPEELARLKAIVERYKTGEVAVVRQEADRKVAATEAKVQAAEQKAAVAEAKVRAAEPAADEKKRPGWLTALITLQKAGEPNAKAEAYESRLAEDFKGWHGRTIFTLENGQRWQQTDADEYVTPPMPAPRVRIYPGAFGSFWLELEGVRPRVRVKPLKLE